MRRALLVHCIAALGLLSACSGPGTPLGSEREFAQAPPNRKPLLAPGEDGALPPPSAVFQKARSKNASDRAEARAQLMRARSRAGLDTAPERVSFLDLPDGVAFASLGAVAFAAPPVAGAPEQAASQIRAGFLDALGGSAPRDRAYLADRRFLVLSQASQKGADIRLSLRLYDAEGADAGRVEATGRVGAKASWLALGRRAAEKMLASSQVAAALRGSAGRGFASPGLASRGFDTASVPAAASGVSAQDVAIVAIEGAPGNGGPALEAALSAALKARGLRPSRSEYAPRRISARVAVRRGGAEDRAEIRWLFTERVGDGERVIGEAKQARSLPRGAFDKPWGPLAVQAANAAADAFVTLLNPPKRR